MACEPRLEVEEQGGGRGRVMGDGLIGQTRRWVGGGIKNARLHADANSRGVHPRCPRDSILSDRDKRSFFSRDAFVFDSRSRGARYRWRVEALCRIPNTDDECETNE
jgi:hypothetical protein